MAREVEVPESPAELVQVWPGSCNSGKHCQGIGASGQGGRSPGVCRWGSSTLAREMHSQQVTKGVQGPAARDVGVLESVAVTAQLWLEMHTLSNSPRGSWSWWPRRQESQGLWVRQCGFGHSACTVWNSVQVQSRWCWGWAPSYGHSPLQDGVVSVPEPC